MLMNVVTVLSVLLCSLDIVASFSINYKEDKEKVLLLLKKDNHNIGNNKNFWKCYYSKDFI